MNPSVVTVTAVESKADLERFIKLPWRIYADDPNWVPPLLMERLDHLNPKKNPFFQLAEVAYWIAWRDGQPVHLYDIATIETVLRDATGILNQNGGPSMAMNAQPEQNANGPRADLRTHIQAVLSRAFNHVQQVTPAARCHISLRQ